MKRLLTIAILTLAALCMRAAPSASADTVYVERGTIVIFTDSATSQTSAISTASGLSKALPQTQQPQKPSVPKEKIKPRFAWGADIGPAIDLSGNDMSNFNIELNVGMSRGWINFLGAGAQANISIANSNRSYPFYAIFRTNFRDKPSRLFWELRAGASLNYLDHNMQQTGVFGSTGMGIRLAETSKFTSHMVIGYCYYSRRNIAEGETTHVFKDLHFASVKIGVVF